MRVVIALDRSEYAEIVLEHGLDEANRRQADEIHIITVAASDDRVDTARSRVEAALRDALEAFQPEGRVVVRAVAGVPAEAIAAAVRELAPDLVVIGRFHAPSVADQLVPQIEYPLLVVGIDGPELEPQCPACAEVRRATEGEQLFCAAHVSDRDADLTTRVPSSSHIPSRMW